MVFTDIWQCLESTPKAKVQFGKKVLKRRKLGEFDGDQSVTLCLREESDLTKTSRTELLRQIEADESMNLQVPEKLSNPDKLIISVREDLFKSKVWNKNEGIVYSSKGELDIKVSPKNISRALRIMDTLIKALRHRGHDLKIDNGHTYVIINGEKFPICCREKLSSVKIKGTYSEYTDFQASGILSLRIEANYNTREWVDGKSPLEEKLATLIVYLEMKGKQMREERIEREKRWEELREQERKVKEIQERKEKELEYFKELFRKAKRHDNAEKLRRYAQVLEQNLTTRNILTDELRDKIDWIRKKADWYDPFIEAEDELMRGIDREELKMEKRTFYWLNK